MPLRAIAESVLKAWNDDAAAQYIANDALSAAFAKLRKQLAMPMATAEQIQAARDLYQTDEIEIDDFEVAASPSEGGNWIAAWVWLNDEELTSPSNPTGEPRCT